MPLIIWVAMQVFDGRRFSILRVVPIIIVFAVAFMVFNVITGEMGSIMTNNSTAFGPLSIIFGDGVPVTATHEDLENVGEDFHYPTECFEKNLSGKITIFPCEELDIYYEKEMTNETENITIEIKTVFDTDIFSDDLSLEDY